MIQIQDATTIAIFGPTASGKSYLMQTLMEARRRLVWYDTTFELDSHTDMEHFYSPSGLAERFLTGASYYRIAYHPYMRDVVKEFDHVCRIYWQIDFPRWLVVDEVHEYNGSDVLYRMMKYARKRYLGLILASQRVCDVDVGIRSNARMVILFNTAEMNDLRAIKDSWGTDAMERVKALQPLVYDDVAKQVKQIPECLVYRRGYPLEVVTL
jgi:hypothetical protein